MPKPGFKPGDPLRVFIKVYYNSHTHNVTLGSHSHGGVTAGTDTTESVDLGTVTSGAPSTTA